VLPGVGLDWLAKHGAGAAILRPDRYIFALSRSRQEPLEAANRALNWTAIADPQSRNPARRGNHRAMSGK